MHIRMIRMNSPGDDVHCPALLVGNGTLKMLVFSSLSIVSPALALPRSGAVPEHYPPRESGLVDSVSRWTVLPPATFSVPVRTMHAASPMMEWRHSWRTNKKSGCKHPLSETPSRKDQRE
jgi:hypothetical protein